MPAETKDRAPRTVRSTGERLREALVALSGGHAIVSQHGERAWASITFEGARHIVELSFEGASAIAAGEEFIAALPDHEFAIPGQLVAEATVTGADQILVPEPRLTVCCELLLLKDA